MRLERGLYQTLDAAVEEYDGVAVVGRLRPNGKI